MVKFIAKCADDCHCCPCCGECQCDPEVHLELEYDTLGEAEECAYAAAKTYDAPCAILRRGPRGGLKAVTVMYPWSEDPARSERSTTNVVG